MFLLLIIFSLLLTSCRTVSDMSALEVMSKLDTGDGYLYTDSADISSVNYISSEDLGFLYYGKNIPLSETDYTESYCIFISKGIEPKEIHIFKAKYQSDVDMLKRMLQSRADILSKPQINPNSSVFFSQTGIKCRVLSKGRFVFLLAGTCENAFSDIEKIF